jgi:dTDP-N-acetylfucosamine:lipid II N-acetylfucosaminyltransferase
MNGRGQIVHVCVLDKFIPPFIDFIEKNFDDFATRHIFYISGDSAHYSYTPRANIVQAGHGKKAQLLHLFRLWQAIRNAEKIILHGLWNYRVVQLLALQPSLLKKCCWVMWGGDLYAYQLSERNWKWRINEFFRRPVIRNMGYLITGIPDDVDLARKWYGAKGEFQECFMYTSNLYQRIEVSNPQNTGIKILVGNSADPSNNHSEVFAKLEALKDQNIRIYTPLTYGNQTYAKQVIADGKKLFGNKFEALTNHMSLDQYRNFLGKMDIAIFNHKRQQGLGNILTLLGLGKKVYIRKDVTTYAYLTRIGLKIFNQEEFESMLQPIEREVGESNAELVSKHFSRERLVSQLNEVFKNQNTGNPC